eukprot:2440603-Pyramimonas_sp.AAC.1
MYINVSRQIYDVRGGYYDRHTWEAERPPEKTPSFMLTMLYRWCERLSGASSAACRRPHGSECARPLLAEGSCLEHSGPPALKTSGRHMEEGENNEHNQARKRRNAREEGRMRRTSKGEEEKRR